jgi:predicted RND superfamily exporter protein
MSAIVVLAGVGVLAVSAAVLLAVLIIGIHKSDRRHLATGPQSHSEALARRLLLGVRYPAPSPESTRTESRWPGK